MSAPPVANRPMARKRPTTMSHKQQRPLTKCHCPQMCPHFRIRHLRGHRHIFPQRMLRLCRPRRLFTHRTWRHRRIFRLSCHRRPLIISRLHPLSLTGLIILLRSCLSYFSGFFFIVSKYCNFFFFNYFERIAVYRF